MKQQRKLSRIYQFLKSVGNGDGGESHWTDSWYDRDIVDDIEGRVTLTPVPTVPGEAGSPYRGVTAYGLVYNHLNGKLVKIKLTSGEFIELAVCDVKLEGDKFYVTGRVFLNDGTQYTSRDWFPEEDVYVNVYW